MSGNRLVWNRAETPAEINRMLSVLAEEYPVADCGDGMRIRFEKIAEPGVERFPETWCSRLSALCWTVHAMPS